MARCRPSDSRTRPLLADVLRCVSVALPHRAEKPVEPAVSGECIRSGKVRSHMPAHDAQRGGHERRVAPHDELAGLGDRFDEDWLRSLDDPARTGQVTIQERLSRGEHRLRRMARRIALQPGAARETAPIEVLVETQHSDPQAVAERLRKRGLAAARTANDVDVRGHARVAR